MLWNGIRRYVPTLCIPNIISGELLLVNDELNNVFVKFDRYMKNRSQPQIEDRSQEVGIYRQFLLMMKMFIEKQLITDSAGGRRQQTADRSWRRADWSIWRSQRPIGQNE